MSLIRISESDDFVVDYDKSRGMYRVTIFKDGHFWDEVWFDAYEDRELPSMEKHMYDYASAYVKGASEFIQYVDDCYGMWVPVSAYEMRDMLKDFLKRIGTIKEISE